MATGKKAAAAAKGEKPIALVGSDVVRNRQELRERNRRTRGTPTCVRTRWYVRETETGESEAKKTDRAHELHRDRMLRLALDYIKSPKQAEVLAIRGRGHPVPVDPDDPKSPMMYVEGIAIEHFHEELRATDKIKPGTKQRVHEKVRIPLDVGDVTVINLHTEDDHGMPLESGGKLAPRVRIGFSDGTYVELPYPHDVEAIDLEIAAMERPPGRSR